MRTYCASDDSSKHTFQIRYGGLLSKSVTQHSLDLPARFFKLSGSITAAGNSSVSLPVFILLP